MQRVHLKHGEKPLPGPFFFFCVSCEFSLVLTYYRGLGVSFRLSILSALTRQDGPLRGCICVPLHGVA